MNSPFLKNISKGLSEAVYNRLSKKYETTLTKDNLFTFEGSGNKKRKRNVCLEQDEIEQTGFLRVWPDHGGFLKAGYRRSSHNAGSGHLLPPSPKNKGGGNE